VVWGKRVDIGGVRVIKKKKKKKKMMWWLIVGLTDKFNRGKFWSNRRLINARSDPARTPYLLSTTSAHQWRIKHKFAIFFFING